MSTAVDVLIVVDVEGALAAKNLNGNVYMVDTNKFFGSYTEGGEELVTTVSNGENIVWSISPVDPATSVTISGFNGNAIGQQIAPVAQPDGSWFSQVSVPINSSGTQYQYSVNLTFEGTTLGFDPFLQSQ
ncbi:MAG TPA: hypothetical protein VIE43_00125 [Thermoanaerobaculia bacterium]|jgi:hypothetical protein|nr:hypothetical protein [Thermoanaerobaculia bacterium]